MAAPRLHIDLDALVANWRMIQRRVEPAYAAAVVKADAYGLGAKQVATALQRAGCSRFYVAWPQEGASLRRDLGPDCRRHLSGHDRHGEAPAVARETREQARQGRARHPTGAGADAGGAPE